MVPGLSSPDARGVTVTRPLLPEYGEATPGHDPAGSDGALDRDLRAALVHATDSLAVAFEPQVALVTGALLGLEAHVLWRHPDRGVLSAKDFLAAGRDASLVVAVAEHVLVQALSQLAAWRTLPGCSELHLVVNVTGAELLTPGRVGQVTALLDAIGLPARALVIEVLEDVLLEPTATRSLQRFAAAGVRVALDRFGTGASSLHHLRVLPVSFVKVDRSFTEGLGRRRRDEAIMRAVTTLSTDLGAQCVAAGVDTAEQLAWLQDNHVPVAQGAALHTPMTPAAVTALLRSL